MMTYGDIVPDPIQNELRDMRERGTHDSWRLGDIAILRYAMAVKLGEDLSVREIRSAIGHFRGISARSVRYYERVAHFFPPRICAIHADFRERPDEEGGNVIDGVPLTLFCKVCRVHFGEKEAHQHVNHTVTFWCHVCGAPSANLREAWPAVSFKHYWLAAKTYNQPHWREVLDYADHGGYQGGPISFDICETHFKIKYKGSDPANDNTLATVASRENSGFLGVNSFISTMHELKVLFRRYAAVPDRPLTPQSLHKIQSIERMVDELIEEMTSDRVVTLN